MSTSFADEKKRSYILAIVILAIHLLILSIDWHQIKLLFQKQALRSTSAIRINWSYHFGNNQIHQETSGPVQNPLIPHADAKNTAVAPKMPQRNSFSFSTELNTQDLEGEFLRSQKIRQINEKNAQLARSGSAQAALHDLKSIFFANTTATTSSSRCCVVTLNKAQAKCNTEPLSQFYQNIFDSLQWRLQELTREGIKEFCE
jgi:hypothetical protein